MDELERKLRSALTEMAEEVPPSHHPWAEHLRRTSARRSRRPFLMAAAAAAVVALIAVPVMILQMRPESTQAADIPEPAAPRTETTTNSSASGFQPDGRLEPQAGEKILTQPVVLMSDGPADDFVRTMAYTTERNGQKFLCLAVVRGQNGSVTESSAGSTCSKLNPPRPGKVVWGSLLATSTTPSGQMLYVASPPTDSVLVRMADGSYAGSLQLSDAGDFSVFTVYLTSNKPPVAFTARDKAKATLENG